NAGIKNDLWAMAMSRANDGNTVDVWHSINEGDTLPVVRKGHAAVFDTRPVFATVPELLEPGVSGTQSLTSAEKRISLYPFMFQLRSGKLFYGGNGPEETIHNSISWVLSSGSNPTWGDTATSGFT